MCLKCNGSGTNDTVRGVIQFSRVLPPFVSFVSAAGPRTKIDALPKQGRQGRQGSRHASGAFPVAAASFRNNYTLQRMFMLKCKINGVRYPVVVK